LSAVVLHEAHAEQQKIDGYEVEHHRSHAAMHVCEDARCQPSAGERCESRKQTEIQSPSHSVAPFGSLDREASKRSIERIGLDKSNRIISLAVTGCLSLAFSASKSAMRSAA
jgi:hypothetical protein